MKKWKQILLIMVLALTLAGQAATAEMYGSATSRVKDLAKVQGARGNQLIGYGLVVGLTGTGDTNKSKYTFQSIANMLKSFGVNISVSSIDAKNVASVMVTAQLPAFVKPGDTVDVTVSSMGDAKSLQGGTLLQTPLKAGNGNVYAVAQGPLTLGGFAAGSGGSSQQKNFLTAGSIPAGAFVERDVPNMKFASRDKITLTLNQPDFTTASRIAEAIDNRFGSVTTTNDPGTIDVTVPGQYAENVVAFVAALEELPVSPDSLAKVVVNERTGTIVIGSNVTIDAVAVAQGGLSVRINPNRQVSQPEPLSGGNTAVTTNPTVNVKETPANLISLPASSNVGDVVSALNAVGATPRDIISILQAIKAAGALHADLQVM
ncbi:MAG TPA: flagellar basal body P-ring protein FlgI [Patescibacteria group bacterium]|nr:flagellar basal body P-ring protein FlgI [Patescibacteria group bacterium]